MGTSMRSIFPMSAKVIAEAMTMTTTRPYGLTRKISNG